jgi:hypothetical protein
LFFTPAHAFGGAHVAIYPVAATTRRRVKSQRVPHLKWYTSDPFARLVQVTNPNDPIGSRREYQAWRIWGMKRARAAMEAGQTAPVSIDGRASMSTRGGQGDADSEMGESMGDSSFLPGSSFDNKANALGSLAPVKTRRESGAHPR